MLVATKLCHEAWLDGRPDTSNSEGEQKSWMIMGNMDVPSKVKIFLWRLARQSLPTTDLLHHRNMATVTSCGICGATDSQQHSLLNYNIAQCVWVLEDADLVAMMDGTREPNAKQWIFSVLDNLPHDGFIKIVVTLWAIWHSRRKALHEQIFQSPLVMHNFMKRYIRELGDCKPKKV